MGYNPSYKWTNPTYPIYNQGYNPLTKWDEPPSTHTLSYTAVETSDKDGCGFNFPRWLIWLSVFFNSVVYLTCHKIYTLWPLAN